MYHYIFDKSNTTDATSEARTAYPSGDRFTKVIVNRKSKITLKISLRARIRAFH
jgi:hypothetical protein